MVTGRKEDNHTKQLFNVKDLVRKYTLYQIVIWYVDQKRKDYNK